MSKVVSEERKRLIDDALQINEVNFFHQLISIKNFSTEEISYIVDIVKDRKDLSAISIWNVDVDASHYHLMIQLLQKSNYINTLIISVISASQGDQCFKFINLLEHQSSKELLDAIKVKNQLQTVRIEVGHGVICNILKANFNIKTLLWRYPGNYRWLDNNFVEIYESLKFNTNLTEFRLQNVLIEDFYSNILQDFMLCNKMLNVPQDGNVDVANFKSEWHKNRHFQLITSNFAENSLLKKLSLYCNNPNNIELATRIIMSRVAEPIALELSYKKFEEPLDSKSEKILQNFCLVLSKTEKVCKVDFGDMDFNTIDEEKSKQLIDAIKINKNIKFVGGAIEFSNNRREALIELFNQSHIEEISVADACFFNKNSFDMICNNVLNNNKNIKIANFYKWPQGCQKTTENLSKANPNLKIVIYNNFGKSKYQIEAVFPDIILPKEKVKSNSIMVEFKNHVSEVYTGLTKISSANSNDNNCIKADFKNLTKFQMAQIVIYGEVYYEKLRKIFGERSFVVKFFRESCKYLADNTELEDLYLNTISVCYMQKAAPILRLGFPIEIVKMIEEYYLSQFNKPEDQLIEYKAVTHSFDMKKLEDNPEQLKTFLVNFKKSNKDAYLILSKFILQA